MKMVLTRLVMMEECPWLERDLEEGDVIYRYDGSTYGCISPAGIACTYDGHMPFFEAPRDAVAAITSPADMEKSS